MLSNIILSHVLLSSWIPCQYLDGMTTGATRATRKTGQDLAGGGHVGGRFWALAAGSYGEDDDEDDALPGGPPAVASPTPSDMLCESLAVGYSEDEVAALVDVVVVIDDPAWVGLQASDQVDVLRWIVHR